MSIGSDSSEHVSHFLRAELEQVKKELPLIDSVKLIAAVPTLVRAEIRKTEYKQLAVNCLFQPSYPDEPLVTELKSKTLADKFLDGLAKVCDSEAKKLKGKQQVIHVVNFVRSFIEENRLCVCADEISAVKRLLTGAQDEIKLKQKSSEVLLKVHCDRYFMHIKVSVPDEYPLVQVVSQITHHNFPDLLSKNFQAQAIEIARRCVQPPLKQKPKNPPFVIRPSLQPTCQYLIECVQKYPQEVCPLCQDRVMPVDPEGESSPKSKQGIEKVYCGHLFHFICLNKYMKTPPFTGGKPCPSCGKQIFHEKWRVSTEVLENRWAHKQARQRELEEVADFME